MSQPLVSVCSPCYNVAPYIGEFLDSLLAQTYKHLQIILVNDGSTDSTGDVIRSYIPRLEAEGYEVILVEQENGGLPAAIHTALKHVTGELLTWPDPDDWLHPQAIEKRVAFLQEHEDVALVRCNAEKIEDGTKKSLGTFEPLGDSSYLISDYYQKLVRTQTWFGAGSTMVRMSCFDAQVPNRDIYVTKRGGQNWQLLLPIAMHYPCWQMQEVLGYYRVRQNSHSHSLHSLADHVAYCDMCETILLQTLATINAPAADAVCVRKIYAAHRLAFALRLGTTGEKRHYYQLARREAEHLSEHLSIIYQMYTPSLCKSVIGRLLKLAICLKKKISA